MLRVLGEVSAELGPPKQRCLLAALAVDAGRVVPVDRLLDRVWGDAVPLRGRETLHSYVSRARQVIGSDVAIERRSGGYVLTGSVDLQRSRELGARARAAAPAEAARLFGEALALWHGEPLAGISGEWADQERDRLVLERLALVHDLADARLALGHGGRLVAELSAAAAERPWDERIAGQHLLALHQAGRTADALETYRRVRERLVEELGVEPGAALRNLHALLLAGTPQPAAAVPRHLPAAPTPFVGRAEELEALDAAVDASTGTVVISAMAGAGGIGKTWLALHWAHARAARFPDGQLFVDLLGFTPDTEPLDPAGVLRGFLDALGVDAAQVPAEAHARAALFRSLVADRRMLVLLDNAAAADQVVPLLPGTSTCTVLVTSRRVLPTLVARHGAHHLGLTTLAAEEARTLLAQRLGPACLAEEPEAAEDLLDWCRGFPLALGLLAGRVLTNPGLPLAELAKELRELGAEALDDDPAAGLTAVFAASEQALTAEQRRVFCLLGQAPGADIGLAAAANLTGLTTAGTARVLRELTTTSLVHQNSRGRYAMHDLVREHAAKTAAPDTRASRRVRDFYLHTARLAAQRFAPVQSTADLAPAAEGVWLADLPDATAAVTWLDEEFAVLRHLLHQAAADERHRTVWQIAWNLRTYVHRQGQYAEDLEMWQLAAAATLHLPDPKDRVRSHFRLGRAFVQLNRLDEASTALEQALAQAQEHNLGEQVLVHCELAAMWEGRGDEHKALSHAHQALTASRTTGGELLVAQSLNLVGWYATRTGDHDLARLHCEEALTLYRKHDYQAGVANTLDSLGHVDHQTGRHREAITRFHESIAVLRELGHHADIADVVEHLAPAHAALGEHEQAEAAWTEALTLYDRFGRTADATRLRTQLANHTRNNR
ncbi:AfsR/SARP family transcriptional regulator [Lentzea sp.]|uniref:AfsR/SARP family transcriptional regulator n=1 Tax=Lentzea sp. TaxID=56099 RepID=UPI002ED04B7A